MFLTILTFISAISISIIAAGYSIIGLATLFAGAAMPIIAMGSALEIGKLVAASWLYNNWSSTMVPKALKAYLFTAIIVLVFITSMGIFGFLSKAHLDQVKPTSGNTIKIKTIDNQIVRQQNIIDRSEKTLTQLDKSIEVFLNNDFASRGLKERQKQEEERNQLNTAIKSASDEIAKLSNEKATLQLAQDKIEAEVGPIKYIAELIYGKDAQSYFDEAVRIVILILIFVFDPLAVLLLIAANISLRQIRLKKNLTQLDEKEQLEKRVERQQSKIDKLKEKDRDFRKLVTKVGELKDMNEDEIKLKLNQIYDWNDKNN
jgi:peptidoglycan hydrolase CwlO-like protein